MERKPPSITPESKVGEILRHYPQLAETLVALSPEFERLKNPVLRATVAKVATLAQVAKIGGVSVADLVNALRRAAGVEASAGGAATAAAGRGAAAESGAGAAPAWFSRERVAATFDARPAIEEGRHPLPDVVRAAEALGAGEILELITPFEPAPLIEVLRGKGFDAWGERRGARDVRTHFVRRGT